jgi:hypothetical protein
MKRNTEQNTVRNMQVRFFVFGAVFLLIKVALSPSPALAFNVDGLWSGMSRSQVAVSVARLGLHASNGADGDIRLSTPVTPGSSGLDANLGFCGDVLVLYRRNISSDSDYATTLSRIFSVYGPPITMSFRGDISTDLDSGSGVMQSYVITRWQRGNDRVELKSYFDWRIQQGNLGRFQPATLLYEMRNPCAAR